MAPMLKNVIAAVAPNPGDYTVTLTWADDTITVSQFRHLVGKGVFTSLADPAIFAQARIGPRGRSLEWPGEIDFCADALWFEAHPEDTPGTLHREHVP